MPLVFEPCDLEARVAGIAASLDLDLDRAGVGMLTAAAAGAGVHEDGGVTATATVGTGTASGGVCPVDGTPEPFAGPRSRWAAREARAVHGAMAARL